MSSETAVTAAETPAANGHGEVHSTAGFKALMLGSIGVVYGDIGTSPLYALREAIVAASGHAGTASPQAVLGVLSLILWALIVVVTLKYVVILLRADNNGEGGTLALMALAQRAVTKGGTVIIADGHSAPRETVDPGMIFSQATPPAADASLAQGEFSWTPEKSDHGPVTILFTAADKQVYVYRNGIEIGRAPFTRGVSGMHIYSALDGADAEGRRKWVRVDGAPAAKDPSFTDLATGAGIPAAFIASVRSVVLPGTTMVLTDKPVNGETQSKPGFKILGLGQVAAR